MGFAELSITSNFTFLTGGSHPEEYARRAALLGLPAIAIADVNSVAGVVRAWSELKKIEEEIADAQDVRRVAQVAVPAEGVPGEVEVRVDDPRRGRRHAPAPTTRSMSGNGGRGSRSVRKRATCNCTYSLPRGPTSCAPMGMPSRLTPAGNDDAGCPEMLKGEV